VEVKEMIQVEGYEQIRRAYFDEHKSIRAIARELNHAPKTIRKALASAASPPYTLKMPRAAPRLGRFKARIDELLAQNDTLPRKQHYTGHTIFKDLQAAGYQGSESHVRSYVARWRRARQRPAIYLPLAFEPGQDAQVDWGEADVLLAGARVTVQYFVMRLCYSRRLFVRAYPAQKQEAFFEGHVRAFHHFEGVPHRIWYDNLSQAVHRVLEGRTREEQRTFVVFRSQHLFESRYCTPGEGHEKGGVESDVGYVRRNFFVPLPDVPDFAALNAQLLAACRQDDQRQVARQPVTSGEAWALERPCLRPVPAPDFACCVTVPVSLNPYGMVSYDTNWYSVPADQARPQLLLKAYPFEIEVSDGQTVIARHARCYGHQQDIFDPLHYLPLLEARPGAFEHAKPLRQWRTTWPAVYEQLLATLRARGGPESGIIREFVQILSLHRDHPATLVEQAITQALAHGCPHLDGVRLCLHQVQHPDPPPVSLDMSTRPHLAAVGHQPLNWQAYEQLLGGA
jgi:transposase